MNSKQRAKRIKDLFTLHVFASNYHSGQWSRGYRLSCRTKQRLTHYGINLNQFPAKLFHNAERTKLYRQLVRDYERAM